MSQNRETKDREGVIRGLRNRAEGDDLEIADILESNRVIPGRGPKGREPGIQ